jgi:hypothetical protein
MPRPDPADVHRFHHLQGIPPEYQKVLYPRRLCYSYHANGRYARRVEHMVAAALRPNYIDARKMQLLAADVADDKVVMQVWRSPLRGQEQDIVLAVSDTGKVATVWVVERSDLDGIRRPKAARKPRGIARDATSLALPPADSDTAPIIAAVDPAAGWRFPWAWAHRAIRNVLTHRRKKPCLKPPRPLLSSGHN